MTTSLEQKKLIACAELERFMWLAKPTNNWPELDIYMGYPPEGGLVENLDRMGDVRKATKEEITLQIIKGTDSYRKPDYATSLDAIVPVVIKWCGDDNRKKAKFEFELCEILYKAKVSDVINIGIIKSDYLLLPTPSQIRDALLLAAGKMPVE